MEKEKISVISPIIVGCSASLVTSIIFYLLYRFEDIKLMSNSLIINAILILFLTLIGGVVGFMYEKYS